MARGGARPGSGRKPGSVQAVTAKAREAAMETGLLPHEWLLKVSRGEAVEQKRWVIVYDKNGKEKSRELVTEEVYADFPTRIDAAKAAAPYYAPKLAIQQVNVKGGDSGLVAETMKEIAEKLPV